MKTLILLLLAPVILSAQAPKKCSEIIVKNVTLKAVVNNLLDHGYVIEKIDSNYGTIRTEPKNYSQKVGGMVSFDIRVKDNQAHITGFCGLSPSDFIPRGRSFFAGSIENRGMKGSLLKESFEAMDGFALSFNAEIVYL